MPSLTIVPEAMATSTTLEPQALPTVPMSTASSWVQLEGETTRRLGLSGKTRPELDPLDVPVLPVGGAVWAVWEAFLPCWTQLCSVLAVTLPTVPLAGVRSPTSRSHVCTLRTSPPREPMRRTR